MADKTKIRYTYRGYEAWQASEPQLKKLIQDDTGVEFWIETRSIPPMGIPPPVTKDCVEKLKGLDGVEVTKSRKADKMDSRPGEARIWASPSFPRILWSS